MKTTRNPKWIDTIHESEKNLGTAAVIGGEKGLSSFMNGSEALLSRLTHKYKLQKSNLEKSCLKAKRSLISGNPVLLCGGPAWRSLRLGGEAGDT